MSRERLTNFARTTLAQSITHTETVIEVHDGQYFPSENFYIVIDASNADHEIVWISHRDGNTLYCESSSDRGLRGTPPVEHRRGALVIHTILAHHVEEAIRGTQLFLPGRPQGNTVIKHTFDSDVSGFTASAGTLTVVGGKLSLSHTSNVYALSPDTIDDGELVYRDILLGGEERVITFRRSDSNNGYDFYYSTSDNSWKLDRQVSGSWTNIAASSILAAPGSGKEFYVVIRLEGDGIAIYVNDVCLADIVDASHSSGSYGVGVNNSTITVDEIEKTSLPDNWKPNWRGGRIDLTARTDIARWDVDVPPMEPHELDDEFDGDALDASWSVINDNGLTYSVSNSKLTMTSTANGASWNAGVIAKDAPAGDFSAVVKASPKFISDPQYVLGGLGVRNSSNGRMMTLGRGIDNYNETLRLSKWASPTSPSHVFSRQMHIATHYIRVRKIGTQIYLDVSREGTAWANIFNETIATYIGSVDQVVLLADCYQSNTSKKYSQEIDYIRFSTNTSEDAPIFGRNIYLDREKMSDASSVSVDDSAMTHLSGPDLQSMLESIELIVADYEARISALENP